jgi:hypothetical protein
MSLIEFDISFDEEKPDNSKLLNEFRVQLINVKDLQNDFHRILPNLSDDKKDDIIRMNVLFARLIIGLHRGIESMTKNINFGFNTQEEASSACRDVIRAKVLISETYPQLMRNFRQFMLSG